MLQELMRKRNKKTNILSRTKSQRGALLKTLVASLFLHGKIKTTKAKAKELKSLSERFITRAKDNKMQNRRILARILSPVVVKKLINEIAPQYNSRQGGYTRIVNLGERKSDGARMVIIELVK